MSARVLIVKNIGREGPGLLRDVLMNHRVEADVIDIERGETVPDVRGYAAMVVLGGPASANDQTEAMRSQIASAALALESDVPYIGICLGHQVLAKAVGATVGKAPIKEVGFFDASGAAYEVTLTDAGRKDPLFDGVEETFRVFQLHGETVMPSDAVNVLAAGDGGSIQALRVGRRAYGLQMHVEVVPEMLAVWCAQDVDLASCDAADLQRQFSDISASYIATGRRIFNNFLNIADLTSPIDLTESEQNYVR